jgi:hypothetical protein
MRCAGLWLGDGGGTSGGEGVVDAEPWGCTAQKAGKWQEGSAAKRTLGICKNNNNNRMLP